MRFSKSTSRGATNAGCVWESTKPGRTTRPAQSISRIFLRFRLSHESRTASFVRPTATIFPPTHNTAASSTMPNSLSSEPRRGPGRSEAERKVRSWPMVASRRACGSRLAARFALHWNLDPGTISEITSLFVARVRMADDSHTRICGEHTLDPFRHHVSAVGHGYLRGMQGVPDPYAAAVVNGNPAGARRGAQ